MYHPSDLGVARLLNAQAFGIFGQVLGTSSSRYIKHLKALISVFTCISEALAAPAEGRSEPRLYFKVLLILRWLAQGQAIYLPIHGAPRLSEPKAYILSEA